MCPIYESMSRIFALVHFLYLRKMLFTNLSKVKRQFGVMEYFDNILSPISI